LERSFQAECEAWATAPGGDPAAGATEWNELEGTRPFVAQVEGVLGEASEPDPLFFVESWTVGVAAAKESFLHRRQQKNREPGGYAYRALDSFMPFFSAEEYLYGREQVRDAEAPGSSSAALTAEYAGSWPAPLRDEAVGVAGGVGQNPGSQLGAAFGEEYESGPLTLQGACRLLGVAASSTREQIKAAYRRMASRYHPDRLERRSEQERQSATERMVSINEAYHLLCGTQLRETA
jgi:DnaJ-domain-containing protein 1